MVEESWICRTFCVKWFSSSPFLSDLRYRTVLGSNWWSCWWRARLWLHSSSALLGWISGVIHRQAEDVARLLQGGVHLHRDLQSSISCCLLQLIRVNYGAKCLLTLICKCSEQVYWYHLERGFENLLIDHVVWRFLLIKQIDNFN